MKVFVTRPIPDQKFDLLTSQNIEIDVYEKDDICTRDVLLKRVVDVDAVITQTDDNIDAEFFAHTSARLKIIANYGIGFSNVDLAEAKARGVVVTNTPVTEAFDATAEATVCLLTSIAKRIPYLHLQSLKGLEVPFSFIGDQGVSLRNKVTGVLGLGNIGSRVARMMHNGFNNQIIYVDVPQRTELEEELGAKKVELHDLMREADFICVNLPFLPSTADLIGKKEIELMKNTAVFVNAARPGIVDDVALVDRLNRGELHGAGLDIYTDAVDELKAENVALTAHLANAEVEAFTAMANCCVENVVGVLYGEGPISRVA